MDGQIKAIQDKGNHSIHYPNLIKRGKLTQHQDHNQCSMFKVMHVYFGGVYS